MKCPNCGKPTGWQDNPTRPFCSERCKLLDFGAWANEEYTVPSDERPLAEEFDQNIEDTQQPN
ncbi:MAG TPA: DNA gyrase inhibitor YacG [Pyrinomonadaceae bacterium]|jgi:hypothetical protein